MLSSLVKSIFLFICTIFAIDILAQENTFSNFSNYQLSQLEINDENMPVVVFLPGIFGSTLESEGKLLWGDNLSNSSDLKYAPEKKVTTHILRRISSYDVYDPFLKRLDSLVLNSNFKHFECPYDWRKDIRKIAKDFSVCLKNDVIPNSKNRPIIFIAHSMGGLVLKWWYKFEMQKISSFPKIEKVIFVGTPHKGTPSAIRTILYGWSRDNDSFWAFIETNFVPAIKNLNKALPSFYSGYELLPTKETGTVTSSGGETLNPYQFKVWKTYGWNLPFSKNGFSDNEIKEKLQNAKKFRSELGDTEIPNAVYFFGERKAESEDNPFNETPSSYLCNKDTKKCDLESGHGDNTVLSIIAKDYSSESPTEFYHQVDAEHMDLLKHPAFLDYLKNVLERYAQKSTKKALQSSHSKKNREDQHHLIYSLFWNEGRIKKTADTYNKTVIADRSTMSETAAGLSGGINAPTAIVSTLSQFQSLKSATEFRYAIGDMLKNALQNSLSWTAVDLCQLALRTEGYKNEDVKLKVEILNNCGLAYKQTGYTNVGRTFWQKSLEFSSKDAQVLLKKYPTNVFDSIKWDPIQTSTWINSIAPKSQTP